MSNDWDYINLIKRLKVMDEKQLLELFHDLNDDEAVDRIGDCAGYYLKHKEDDSATPYTSEISDEEDAISVDNARRHRELKK